MNAIFLKFNKSKMKVAILTILLSFPALLRSQFVFDRLFNVFNSPVDTAYQYLELPKYAGSTNVKT
ncbi:MAG: hypothetical protein JWN76_1681 [Chitinophagaceae bacterium]|nr:hypothetical protein [Chitinophagaceae bacterium]